MKAIVPKVRFSVKERLLKSLRRCRDARVRLRYLVIVNVLNERTVAETEAVLKIHNTTVYRILQRFQAYGEAGLWDGRAENGSEKLDDNYLNQLYKVVRARPPDYGWRRPTWTRELLVATMVRLTGVRIHVATMSRALAQIKARRGRPRPRVGCPWSKAAKTRRLNALGELLATLPRRARAFYEDEVDIHLNPKIGLDWMVQGQQKEVLTPGKNEKRYLAGALDVRTRVVIWVEGDRKTSYLILDNYKIHKSDMVHAALGGYLAGKVQLHFLPPYCPDDNQIERVWQDLHANVTRNHGCADMQTLMEEVRYYLRKRNRKRQHTGVAP
jgi:transposase